ncbi:MAG: SCP2 sterol-binding domain-containing protein [Proteobacteria bacterium]|nr:SCP2 sterol-binding domain-containing protein [Pseudomonadota bacterium]
MNPLATLLADVATSAANASLRLDAELAQRVQRLNGRVMLIETTTPPNRWTCSVHDGRINVEPGETVKPNVVIRGAIADLLTALNGSFDGIQIDGDEATLSEFQAAFKAFRPDVFGPLRQVFGDRSADRMQAAAEDLLGAAEVALQGLRALAAGAVDSVKVEAGKQFVSTQTKEAWLDTLDELKLKLDRLSARTDILERNADTRSADVD